MIDIGPKPFSFLSRTFLTCQPRLSSVFGQFHFFSPRSSSFNLTLTSNISVHQLYAKAADVRCSWTWRTTWLKRFIFFGHCFLLHPFPSPSLPSFDSSFQTKTKLAIQLKKQLKKPVSYFILFHSPFFFSVAYRRPIDSPPIVQLRVNRPSSPTVWNLTTPSRKRRNGSSGSAPGSPTPSAASTARAHPDDSVDAASYAQSFASRHHNWYFLL